MTVESQEFHFREVIPKDFYFAQILRNEGRSGIELVVRLLQNQEILDDCSLPQLEVALKWVQENLIQEKIFSVESWLEIAFGLCKQRWDSSIDWLETQPVSKILTMIHITNKVAERQEQEMKKPASRRK